MTDTIKALSLKEPWASKILNGEKTIETRTWKTKHRGPLLLCCSQKPKSQISGKAFAICELNEIRPMKKSDEEEACCELYKGAYAWIIENVQPIIPFEQKGQLGLYDVERSKVKLASGKDIEYKEKQSSLKKYYK